MTLVFGYLLLALIPLGAIGYVVWDYRRKVADRNHASAERLHELLGAVRQPPATADDSPVGVTDTHVTPAPDLTTGKIVLPPVSPAPAASSSSAGANPPVVTSTAQARVLSPPQTLVYLLLKTTLPEKIVLARTRLDAVLELPPADLAQFAAFELHFVVAERDMRPLTVIRLEEPNGRPAAVMQWAMVRSHLESSGVRVVELDSTRLPRREGIAHLVVPRSRNSEALQEPLAG